MTDLSNVGESTSRACQRHYVQSAIIHRAQCMSRTHQVTLTLKDRTEMDH